MRAAVASTNKAGRRPYTAGKQRYNECMHRQYLTRFIGRENELAELQRLLAAARLVTITGPGGSGKTRLAVQTALLVSHHFPDDAHFISLAAIHDPTLVIPTLVQALGVAEGPDRLPYDSLKEFLRRRRLLLILDNFEQLLPAAPLLTELLLTANQLKLLVTSREPLRLHSEQLFSLSPLALFRWETAAGPPVVETMNQVESICLFMERAQAVQPGFALTTENGTAVAEICARLDGLPLAIELAAARISLLPPQAMRQRLQESSLQLLTGGPRDAPARQKTLRATIQWSYDLLNAQEQRAFRCLSIFAGGCTMAAAEVVLAEWQADVENSSPQHHSPTSPSPDLAITSFDLLASLVDKNLVWRAGADSEPRLQMLETIREFGQEQLALAGEIEAVQQAHAHYYLSLAEAAEPHLTSWEQKRWLARLEREQDNFRTALQWGSDRQETSGSLHRASFILRLAGALAPFWFLRGHWGEGRRWLEVAIAMPDHAGVDKALRARTLYVGVPMLIYQGDLAQARLLSEQSVTLYRELDDREGLLAALLQLCRTLDYQDETEPLQRRAHEALVLAEALPDSPLKAQAYTELSGRLVSSGAGYPTTAVKSHLEESIHIYRAHDNPAGLANALFFYAEFLKRQGDTARAQALHAEAEGLLVDVDDHRLKMILYAFRLTSNWRAKNYPAARRAYEQLLAHQPSAALAKAHLEILAATLYRQNLALWAARVYGLADQAIRLGPRRRVYEHVAKELAAARHGVRAQLGEAAFTQALAEGAALTADDLLAIPYPARNRSQSDSSNTIPFEPLTARELEVLHLLAQELKKPEIAAQLVISPRTVDAHLRAIYGKLGVRSRDAAVRVAMKEGLLAE